ncbi:MAG TPA: exodeoxyribonuclease III [Candidatus Gracilibacteria bacterium]
MVKIISWNVNGLRSVERKGNLKKFLEQYDPDIFLMQETKSKPDQVAFLAEAFPDYEKYYHSAEKPGYAGTGIWLKKGVWDMGQGVRFQNGFPEAFKYDDNEGRISRIDLEIPIPHTPNPTPLTVLGVYFPNGGKSPEAWDDKLVFYDKFLRYVNEIQAEGRQVIWCGDVNCAHQEIDIARPKENEKSIGFLPEERSWISKCIEEGWVDVFRDRYPDTVIYSWWHLISRARSRNVGWRIDYFFAHHTLKDQIQDITYLNDQMGSDHCPVQLVLK